MVSLSPHSRLLAYVPMLSGIQRADLSWRDSFAWQCVAALRWLAGSCICLLTLFPLRIMAPTLIIILRIAFHLQNCPGSKPALSACSSSRGDISSEVFNFYLRVGWSGLIQLDVGNYVDTGCDSIGACGCLFADDIDYGSG